MTPCNVDFFDRSMMNIYHASIEPPEIDWDYLSPNESSIEIPHTMQSLRGCIIIFSGYHDYIGIVSGISEGKYIDSVNFKHITTLFEHEIVYDTLLEKEMTIEAFLSYHIRNSWIESDDPAQNYSFSVETFTETNDWTLDVDSGESTKTLLNLYQDVIYKAITKYRISINAFTDYQNKKIVFRIGKIGNQFNIETDVPSVEIGEFVIKGQNNSINKLIIWDSNYTNKITYYLHNDGTYNTADIDRVVPVRFGQSIVYPSETDSFEALARNEALNRMELETWRNLIDITVNRYDPLINPEQLEIGQPVRCIKDGVSYFSILTGKRYHAYDEIDLIFGWIRHDLTKKLRRDN